MHSTSRATKWRIPKFSLLNSTWQVVDRIGRGRYSEVYKAVSKTDRGKLVAVKADIPPIKQPGILKKEFEIMEKMAHSPYVCRVEPNGWHRLRGNVAGVSDGGEYIVMELCCNYNLSDERKQHPAQYFGPQRAHSRELSSFECFSKH